MALTVLVSPILCYSGNPVPIHVEAGTQWIAGSGGDKWDWYINFSSDTVTAGEKIIITLFGVDITIEVISGTTSPTDDEIHVQSNPGSTPIDTWILGELRPQMRGNYSFGKYITLTIVSTGLLSIQADYETFLKVSTDIAGTTVTLNQAGTPSEKPDSYHVLCEVRTQKLNEGSYTSRAILKAIPEYETPYAAKFDLSEIIDSIVSRTLPSFAQNTISIAYDNFCYVKSKIVEGYGNPVIYQSVNEHPTLCLKGAISLEYFPVYASNLPIFLSDKWQTWQPSSVPTGFETHQYLLFFPIINFVSPPPNVGVILMVHQYNIDGTDNEVPVLSYTLDTYKPYIIPAGIPQLGLSTSNIAYYEVYLVDDTTGLPITPKQTYKVDRKDYNGRDKSFLFGNSLGGFDTLRCTTNAIVGFEISHEEYKQHLEYDFEQYQGQTRTSNVAAKEKNKVNTGWVSLEYIKYLHDFLISDEIYEVKKEHYCPINLAVSNVTLYKNNDHLYALEFEYYNSYNADHFSLPIF
jgi:hypothetical protein